MLKIKTFCVNMMHENTYVVSDDSGECVIIDCGCYDDVEREELASYIDSCGLKPQRLLCTHFHLDHVFGIKFIKERYGLDAEINPADHLLHEMAHFQAIAFGLGDSVEELPAPKQTLDDGVEIKFGNTTFTVIATPGHSPGGISLYCQSENIVFTGDTLFYGTYGAVNLPGGRLKKLYRSITEKLFTLPGETIVYPGHGQTTTIGDESKTNPILLVDGSK